MLTVCSYLLLCLFYNNLHKNARKIFISKAFKAFPTILQKLTAGGFQAIPPAVFQSLFVKHPASQMILHTGSTNAKLPNHLIIVGNSYSNAFRLSSSFPPSLIPITFTSTLSPICSTSPTFKILSLLI